MTTPRKTKTPPPPTFAEQQAALLAQVQALTGPEQVGTLLPRLVEMWLAQFRTTRLAGQFADNGRPFLTNSALVAEMTRQWKDDPTGATAFWTHVFAQNHPEPTHVTRVLGDTYRVWNVRRRGAAWDAEPWRAKAAKAWQAFQQECAPPTRRSAQPSKGAEMRARVGQAFAQFQQRERGRTKK